MAKALLLNALHDVLADYVVGLSPESLKVGVWSGKIVLNELQVKCDTMFFWSIFSTHAARTCEYQTGLYNVLVLLYVLQRLLYLWVH